MNVIITILAFYAVARLTIVLGRRAERYYDEHELRDRLLLWWDARWHKRAHPAEYPPRDMRDADIDELMAPLDEGDTIESLRDLR